MCSKLTILVAKLNSKRYRETVFSADYYAFSNRLWQKLSTTSEKTELTRLLTILRDQATIEEFGRIVHPWSAAILDFAARHLQDTAITDDYSNLFSCGASHKQELASRSFISQLNKSNILWQSGDSKEELFIHSNLLIRLLNNASRALADRPDLGSNFLEDFLIGILLECHHPIITDAYLWTTICQNVRIDPQTLVTSKSETALQLCVDSVSFQRQGVVSHKTTAAFSALTTLAFVAPDVVVPRIVSLMTSDYMHRLQDVDETVLDIWQCDDDVLCRNVLAKEPEKAAPRTNGKDWQTKEWEESVKASIAAKKKQAPKLTSEQQSILNVQLSKEQATRRHIESELFHVRRALGLIEALMPSFIDVQLWLSEAIRCLLSSTTQKTKLFLDDQASETYLRCCTDTDNLDSQTRLIGSAMLSVAGDQESTAKREIINKVLYKFRYESENNVLATRTVICLLPLLIVVLQAGAQPRLTGCQDDDQLGEQVFLVLEILNHITTVFNNPALRRSDVLNALVNAMVDRPARVSDIETTLQNFVQVIAENATLEELKTITIGFLASDVNVRTAILTSADPLDLMDLEFSLELWLASHDDHVQNVDLAQDLLESNSMIPTEATIDMTMAAVKSPRKFARECAGRALTHLSILFPDTSNKIISELTQYYWASVKQAPVELDRFGQPINTGSTQLADKLYIRTGIAHAFLCLAADVKFSSLHGSQFISFLFDQTQSTCSPASDPSQEVRSLMLKAGLKVIECQDAEGLERIIPSLEIALEAQNATEASDWVRETAVILYGALASKLDPDDHRVPGSIERLLATLSTPSESVQVAIANCLPPLISSVTDKQVEHVTRLLQSLRTESSYAARRGAAYGLAGVIKGCGLAILGTADVLDTLAKAAKDKASARVRQGALWAYECMSTILGRLFEPYITSIIPVLLLTFADTDTDVRKATQEAARSIMSVVSGYGVQSILKPLLSGLDDHQWRSKKGSVELIGSMAFCAPRQLSSSLPTIIPKLNEVLTDSHAQVRAAGNASLTQFGQVITNPEIKKMVPALLNALSEPNKYTEQALDKLLKTSFLHYIDSPSLSILVPILERGMLERSANTKKKAAKIFGLMASLTDPNDMLMHLSLLVPRLRGVLVDTVPTVRATAAKALGTLISKLGERNFPLLVDDLLGILNSDVANTDRQGAAQGLSEVLAALGVERLEDTLPQILRDARSRLPYVREGFISLLVYLPATFGNRFAPYLAKSISPILAGLADESEFVRDISMKAGKIMIASYATKSVDLMLPELEAGMFNPAWRIRVSSTQLIGDLLFKVSGISSRADDEEGEEDNAVATEAQRAALVQVLGQSRRDRVFAYLYVVRFDSFAMVRSSAINVWKALISNSPKTLKEILPSLTNCIITGLATRDSDQRLIYIETLGDLMRRLGTELLQQLLPSFEAGLQSSSADRIGACVAITEVVQNASAEQLDEFKDRLVSAVKSLLIAQDPAVRSAANTAFDALQARLGSKIVDEVLPELLRLLQSPDQADQALSALQGLMMVRAQAILPVLLPSLLVRPMTGFNLRALDSLVRVSGQALTRRLPLLLNTIADAEANDEAEEAGSTFEAILLAAPNTAESVGNVMNTLLDLSIEKSHKKRAATFKHLAVFFGGSKLDYAGYISDWIRILLRSFSDGSQLVVEAAWEAQNELTKSLRKDQLCAFAATTRAKLRDACAAGADLPGLCLPKGPSAILPIFLQALLYGNPDQKVEAAAGLGDLVQRCNVDTLKPFVVPITGPLIRIVGERSTPEVKSEILSSLRLLLEKVPLALKPFLPQLQRSFTKALSDPTDAVRTKAANALGALITLQTSRIDSLVTELLAGSRNDDAEISGAMLSALFQVVNKAGEHMTRPSKDGIFTLVKEMSGSDSDEKHKSRAAELLGVLFRVLEDDLAVSLLRDAVLVMPATLFTVNALNALLLNSSDKIRNSGSSPDIAKYLAETIRCDSPPIAQRAIIGAGKFLLDDNLSRDFQSAKILMEALSSSIETSPFHASDSQRLALVVVRATARKNIDVFRPHMTEKLGLAVFSCVRSMVIPVKLSAEAAFVAIFEMVDHQNEVLEPFAAKLEPTKARSMLEYARRVASKKAQAESERMRSGVGTREDEDLAEILDAELVGSTENDA